MPSREYAKSTLNCCAAMDYVHILSGRVKCAAKPGTPSAEVILWVSNILCQVYDAWGKSSPENTR